MERNHSVPLGTFFMIWFGLLVLTGVTVTVAGLHLGEMSIVSAILIATVKGALVLFYFMNLMFEKRIFKFMFAIALLTLTVILLLTFVDVSFR
jgi:cytochrome c oxidase subunit 4